MFLPAQFIYGLAKIDSFLLVLTDLDSDLGVLGAQLVRGTVRLSVLTEVSVACCPQVTELRTTPHSEEHGLLGGQSFLPLLW